uniref:DRMBL domain-containing protein n=1 Tax=Caenorhabditis tropicalis TaxID=1561998 RepID=A0A1I7T6F9_9PELO
MRAIKEEPLDYNDCSPAPDEKRTRFIKMENIKLEPFDDNQSISLKQEREDKDGFLDLIASEADRNYVEVPIRKGPIKRKAEKKPDLTPLAKLPKMKKASFRNCSLCFAPQESALMNTRVRSHDQLVISIGLVLDGHFTIKDAKQFLAENEFRLICVSHFYDTFDAICNALQIPNFDHIGSCDYDKLETLMITVNSIDSSVDVNHCMNLFRRCHYNIKHHCHTLGRLALMNEEGTEKEPKIPNYPEMPVFQSWSSSKQKQNPIKEAPIAQSKLKKIMPSEPFEITIDGAICPLCPNKKIKEIQSDSHKLVIVIGMFLSKYISFRRAKLLMESSSKLHIRHQHIPIVVDGIVNTTVEQLMTIIKSLHSSITASQFFAAFKEFVTDNEKIIKENKEDNQEKSSETGKTRIRQTRQVTSESEEQILMLGSLLCGNINEQQAFLTRRSVCSSHFAESVEAIYGFLRIKSTKEIPKLELMTDFMSTVNRFFPLVTQADFWDMLDRFVCKFRIKQIGSVVKEEKEEMIVLSCANEKLVVCIGLLLRGQYSPRKTQSFMSYNLSIYTADLFHLIQKIFEFLQIQSYRSISRYSYEKMEILMTSVQLLNSGISTHWQFSNMLSMFCSRYQKEIDFNSVREISFC